MCDTLCDMTRSHSMWHDSFMCDTLCDMTRSYVTPYVTWHIDMEHGSFKRNSNVRYGSCTVACPFLPGRNSKSSTHCVTWIVCRRSCLIEMTDSNVTWFIHFKSFVPLYGVATTSRLLEMIGLFCKRALWKRLYSAKETYTFKEPTNRSHCTAPHHYMNEPCHTWMSHVAYEWVMSHINEACHIWMSHVAC